MPQPLKDLVGQTFGQLTVISAAGMDEKGQRLWLCECSCGGTKETRGSNLRGGFVKSCGCLPRGAKPNPDVKTKHPLFQSWSSMVQRCTSEKNDSWPNYGGRGIKVHEDWSEFEPFRDWVLENLGERPEGMTLDRVDNDGHYEPGNLKWSSRHDQSMNRRTVKQLQAEANYLLGQLAALGWTDPR